MKLFPKKIKIKIKMGEFTILNEAITIHSLQKCFE